MATTKRFRAGQTVVYKPGENNIHAAIEGARARVVNVHSEKSLIVKWIRDGKDKGQMDGQYLKQDFIPYDPDWDE